jgi:predicted nucleotidyltransferase
MPPGKQEVRAGLAALEKPLRERGITSLALFGSVVHGDARPDSDIDVLIDIDPAARFSLVDLVSVKNFLEERLGREVDVVTRHGIDPAIRERVVREAESVF